MANPFENYLHIIVFDVETTGLDHENDAIIDFGAAVYVIEGGSLNHVESINWLVHTDQEIPKKITELTGIDNAMVNKNGVDEETLVNTLERLFMKKTLAVAYNLQFDISFVHSLMKRHRLDFTLDSDVLDLLVVYKDHHEYPHRLNDAIKQFGIENENAHRAYDDAVATAKLMLELAKSVDLTDYINQIGYHEKYGLSGVRLPHVTYTPQSYKRGSFLLKLKKQ